MLPWCLSNDSGKFPIMQPMIANHSLFKKYTEIPFKTEHTSLFLFVILIKILQEFFSSLLSPKCDDVIITESEYELYTKYIVMKLRI